MLTRIRIEMILGLVLIVSLGMIEVSTAAESAEPMVFKNRFGLSKPLPRTPGAIRFASYNLLNLFDHKDDPAFGGKIDDIILAIKAGRGRALAKVIETMDADILALQEIESLETLLWFRDTYLANAGYRHVVSRDVGHYRGIEQSVMSRFPITDSQIWPGVSLDKVTRVGTGWTPAPPGLQGGLKIRRSPLRVDIKVNDGFTLSVFNLHHKSGPDYRYKRESEALKIVELVKEFQSRFPKRSVIVAGDFNAGPRDKSIKVYLDAGFVDALGEGTVSGKDGNHHREAARFITHESGMVRDYIFLNKIARRRLVTGSAHVFGTVYIGDYDWKKRQYPEGYASDHYPVIVDLIPGDMP